MADLVAAMEFRTRIGGTHEPLKDFEVRSEAHASLTVDFKFRTEAPVSLQHTLKSV